MRGNNNNGDRDLLWGFLAFVGIVAIVALILGAVALSSGHSDEGRVEEHSYCFEARDVNFINDAIPPPPDDDDDQNVAVGRVRVDEHHLCWKLQYLMLDGCELDKIGLFGPVDLPGNGHEDGPLVVKFPDDNLSADKLQGCKHIMHELEQAIIDDPQDYYIGLNFTGQHPYCDKVKVRSHLTGLCRTSSSTEEDFYDHHHHHHGKGKGGGYHDDDDDIGPPIPPSPPLARRNALEAKQERARISRGRN